ncbi:SIR2 family protein [Methylobacterium sp. WSM2598]|uniref:SIR2 family protein n=1 Tax=Methylobacterium sp. WSM2598 TaxID=398261 RepID=UPI0003767184|nr:SIR2 family protein [Methylobacterium sp. WSM2598]
MKRPKPSGQADRDTEDFLSKYLKELNADNAAVFVGAGLSKAAGYVDWPGLLSEVAQTLGLDASKETDLVALAQYHLNSNATNRHQLSQLLIDEFSDLKAPTENHEILARLPIRTFWTTNYDRLIEKALEAGGKRVDTKYTQEHLATTRRGRDAVVYKMHGDIEHPDKAILSKDDYERYHQTHGPFTTALSGDLVEKTFLFLGFSFTDPNLDFIMSRIRATFTNHQRQHYCIARRRARFKGEKEAEYQYALTKQNLVTQDLMRFNIKTIFVDDFPQITTLLKTLEDRYRRRTVFISGSAADYGSWGQGATEEFVAKLSRALIEKDLRITSGFGVGIGGAVVTGAVQQIYSTRQRSVDEQLVLRPFPIGIKDPDERQKTFTRYRVELIAQAGIAVFVMGNKKVGASIVTADGMRSEFELAKERGLFLVPVGASGSMSAELWNEVTKDFDRFFPSAPPKVRKLLEGLGEPTDKPETLLGPLLDLINVLTSGT